MTHLLETLVHAKLTDKILEELAAIMRKFFRIEVEGIENIPKKGNALVISNHSGYAGTDALMISHMIHKEVHRIPKIMAHRAFFQVLDVVKEVSRGLGLEEISVDRGIALLKRGNLVLVFPEGETGNFKPSWKRYHLQRFHTGFVRMAIQAQAPIVPCIVIGAEESHLNLGSVGFPAWFKGMRLPIPFSLIPLPAKWKIKFLEPISVDSIATAAAEDREFNTELSAKIQFRLQHEIDLELKKREYIFFPLKSGETNHPHLFI